MSSPPPTIYRPAFERWPTIKVISYPSGNLPPPVTDEVCFTYCRQDARSRSQNRDPQCKTICLRKVFPHEIRTVLSSSSGSENRTNYPLPPEGQPAKLPRMLGGTRTALDDSTSTPVKHWEQGWYLWQSRTLVGAFERLETMRHNLHSLQRRDIQRQKIRQQWHEYQEFKERQPTALQSGLIVPRKPLPDASSQSLLLHLPPDFTFFERIHKVLQPTQHVLDNLNQNIASGAFYHFGERVWEKAWTKEPFILAERALSKAAELWKSGPQDDDDDRKKRSR